MLLFVMLYSHDHQLFFFKKQKATFEDLEFFPNLGMRKPAKFMPNHSLLAKLDMYKFPDVNILTHFSLSFTLWQSKRKCFRMVGISYFCLILACKGNECRVIAICCIVRLLTYSNQSGNN